MQKTYETYKDSGIEWIGNVPSHWEVFPMKYKVNLYNGNSIKDDEKPLYEDDSDAIPYIATKDVNVDNHSIDYKNGMYVKNIDHSFVRAPKGSTLMCIEGGSAGRKMGFTNQEVAFINKLCCFTTKDISILDNLYLYYYLQSSTFKNIFTSHLSGLIGGVSISEMKNFEMICPPLSEQQAIAEYLDKKCSKIDSLVAELEQQVTDLGTMKKAEISRIVTKGLNPDAPLKDSGIEWIGEIPSHWNIKRLRYLGDTQNGLSKDGSYFGEGYPFITYGDVYKNIIIPKVASGLAKSTKDDQKIYSIERGDVFFTRTSETIEEIGFCATCLETLPQATFSGFLIRFRPNSKELLPEFEAYYFRANLHRRYFVKEMNSVTRASLSQVLLKNLPVLLPPKEEQQAIAEYLDTYCVKVDATVKELQDQIADLKLYKQSIISEAVTGKIKVID